MHGKNSVLLLADQPYQTRLLAKLAERLQECDLKPCLVLTDWFSFLYEPALIEEIKRNGIDIRTQEEMFFTWQGNDPGDEQVIESQLKNWEKKNCLSRSLAQLELTNNYVFSNERRAYELPVERTWERRILLDSITWIEQIFDEIEPSIVFAIDNCTLINNLSNAISEKRNIPHLICKNTRIRERWVARDDFCLGMSAKNVRKAETVAGSHAYDEEVQAYREWFSTHNRGAYKATAHLVSADSSGKSIASAVGAFSRDLADWLLRSLGRIRPSAGLRRMGIVRFEQSLSRLSWVELRVAWVRFLAAIGHHPFESFSPPAEENYIFWALHSRPEGSVLTQAFGQDEEALLEFFASQATDGLSILVKEHPDMFGLRQADFYKRLKRLQSIRLVAPWATTIDYLRGARAVVGVAGTVLLEAEILGKPAWSLGKPEFSAYLAGSGTDGIQDFLAKLIQGDFNEYQSRIDNYLAFVMSESSADDDWLNDNQIPFEKQDSRHTVDRMYRLITKELEEG